MILQKLCNVDVKVKGEDVTLILLVISLHLSVENFVQLFILRQNIYNVIRLVVSSVKGHGNDK